jgi:hypothetical protein
MRGIKEKYNGHSYFTSGFFRQNFPFLVSAASPEFFDLDHHNAYNDILSISRVWKDANNISMQIGFSR